LTASEKGGLYIKGKEGKEYRKIKEAFHSKDAIYVSQALTEKKGIDTSQGVGGGQTGNKIAQWCKPQKKLQRGYLPFWESSSREKD